MSKHEIIFSFIKEKVLKKAEKMQIILDEEINEDFSITGSGLFDSMDFMHLIVEVEDKFGVEVDFSEHEPAVFTTIGGFVKCVK